MNIMSLDAAYGAGTMRELQSANEEHDYGHGQGNPSAMQLEQVPQRAPDAGFSRLAPAQPPAQAPPPGRHVVAQYPGPPQGGGGIPPQPLPPMPPMPTQAQAPLAPPSRHPPQHHQQPSPLPFHPNQAMMSPQPMQPNHREPLRDQQQRYQKATAGSAEVKEKSSFVENHKVLIIVFVVIICLVLGVLVAVLVTQAKKQKAAVGLAGGALTEFGMPGLNLAGGGGGVPQFVGGGGVEFGGHLSSLPTRAWNESASAFLRR